jgi:hypothetical protein
VSVKELSSKKNLDKFEGMLVRRALPLLTERPIRATVRAVIISLMTLVLTAIGIGLAIILVSFILFSDAPSPISGANSAFIDTLALWAFYAALAIVGGAVVFFIVATVAAAVRAWYHVGNSLALMLAFVALFFFSSDAWRIVGNISWWRLIALMFLCCIVSFPVLFRNATPIVKMVDDERTSNPDEFVRSVISSISVADFVKKMATGPHRAAVLDRAALFNLRAVLGIFALGRIVISGLLLSLSVFVVSLIVITQQTTEFLMNSHAISAAGWSKTLQVGNFQFFVSEALVKVALSVGGLAVGYLMIVQNAQPDPDHALAEKKDETFLRKALVLWSCYRTFDEAPSPQLASNEPSDA